MNKKYLLAGGCSYTDENYITNDRSLERTPGAWPMWPEHLGNALGLDVINTGKSGSSNDTIAHNILEQIVLHKDKIDTVAVMWSSMDRKRIFCGFDIAPFIEVMMTQNLDIAYKDGNTPLKWQHKIGIPDICYNFFSSSEFFKVRKRFIQNSIEDSLRAYYNIAEICKLYNIKFISMQGVGAFDYKRLDWMEREGMLNCPEDASVRTYPEEVIKAFIDNSWFNAIEKTHKKNFIGWPLLPLIGGVDLNEMRYNGKFNFQKRKDDYNVSNIDLHPNAEAQKLAAEIYYEKHREIYGV